MINKKFKKIYFTIVLVFLVSGLFLLTRGIVYAIELASNTPRGSATPQGSPTPKFYPPPPVQHMDLQPVPPVQHVDAQPSSPMQNSCDGYTIINGTEETCMPENQCDGYILIEGVTKKCVSNQKNNPDDEKTIQDPGLPKDEENPSIDIAKEKDISWQPPTAEEEALETPLIDPIDLFTMFGGGLLKSLFKGASEVSSEAAEKVMYYYFKDSSGKVADAITENGIKASSGLTRTLGYEGKVFVSEIAPDKISKVNLFSYGVGDADSVAKVIVKESDLAVPAQAYYYGEKGANFIKDSSGLYTVGDDGAKYLSDKVINEVSSLTPYQDSIGSLVNNMTDIPRCLTRYWMAGGLWGYTGYNYFNKK